MTRFLLDTNIVSTFAKPVPSQAVIAWMGEIADQDLFIAALTIGEIHRGILRAPMGQRRDQLERWFAGTEGPRALFAGRILPLDDAAAMVWGRLMAEGMTRGRRRSGIDMIIAAVAETNDCVVVTDNERDFAGLPLFNPMRATP